VSDKLHVKFWVVEGEWDTTDPIQRIAPSNMSIGILQELQVDWDRERKEWHVWGGPEDGSTRHGYSDNRTAAILDWLNARLTIDERDE
jgi:hypothetical protein